MIYQIIIEPQAIEDLLNIKRYISEEDTINKANIFVSELKAHMKTLNEMPQRCRKSYYTDNENTHDLIYKKHTTVFKIIENKVHILTVFRQREY